MNRILKNNKVIKICHNTKTIWMSQVNTTDYNRAYDLGYRIEIVNPVVKGKQVKFRKLNNFHKDGTKL
jgi:hypothetical protein